MKFLHRINYHIIILFILYAHPRLCACLLDGVHNIEVKFAILGFDIHLRHTVAATYIFCLFILVVRVFLEVNVTPTWNYLFCRITFIIIIVCGTIFVARAY